MNMIRAYPAPSAKLGVDGVPLAGVTLAEEYESRSEYPVLGFGDSCPSAILTFDRRFGIVLERDAGIGDGVSFEGIGVFELQLGSRIYSGCRCTELKRLRRLDGSVTERITICALERQEVSAGE